MDLSVFRNTGETHIPMSACIYIACPAEEMAGHGVIIPLTSAEFCQGGNSHLGRLFFYGNYHD